MKVLILFIVAAATAFAGETPSTIDLNAPSVQLEIASTPKGKLKQLYGDEFYRFYTAENQPSADWPVLVTNASTNQWMRIVQVSVSNGKLGRQPGKTAAIYMDFSKIYAGRKFVPVPLRTSANGASVFSILPDKILFDKDAGVYELLFNSSWHDDTVTTRLEIRKKDLDGAFRRRD